MSGFIQPQVLAPIAATPLFIAGNRLLESVLIQTPRYISNIIPDVVIEENHRDELTVTEHPVEQGAAISDHVYKRPAEVTMRCGWSNSSRFGDGTENFVRKVYDELRALQVSGEPFQVVTGKRIYQDMVVKSLAVQNDPRWEYSLVIVAILQQVIIVSTQETQGSAPQTDQAQPQQTAPVIDNGTQQPQAAPDAANRAANKSAMYDIFSSSDESSASGVGAGATPGIVAGEGPPAIDVGGASPGGGAGSGLPSGLVNITDGQGNVIGQAYPGWVGK